MSIVHGSYTHPDGAPYRDPGCPNCREEILTARVKELEEEVRATKAELTAVIGMVQRFQPPGSPPALPHPGFVFWICRTLSARAEAAEAELARLVEGLRDSAPKAFSEGWHAGAGRFRDRLVEVFLDIQAHPPQPFSPEEARTFAQIIAAIRDLPIEEPIRPALPPCVVCGHPIGEHGPGEVGGCRYAHGCACAGYVSERGSDPGVGPGEH